MNTRIYVARHERYEAAETYKDRLNDVQRQFLLDNDSEFNIVIDKDKTYLLEVIDEG